MTAATEPPPRIVTLDVVRGVAVMGILAMNIVAFAFPGDAHFRPTPIGEPREVDVWTWIIGFILVDGKMRGLFSLLFGASLLLVVEKAQAAGLDGGKAHRRRMLWLLLFGLLHYYFIWWGDILSMYAVIGLIAYLFRNKEARSLIKWSIGFFVLAILLALLAFGSPFMLQLAASMPGADPAIVAQWESVRSQIGGSEARMAEDIALHRGGYFGIVEHKIDQWAMPIMQSVMFGPETLAFMLLGMWSLKSGFITGAWDAIRQRKLVTICFAIAVPAYVLLAWLVHRSGYEPAAAMALGMGVGTIFRPLMTLGYAGLIVMIVRRGANGPLGSRIAAAGRAAFTNYLGTSIVATFIFYGWGLGLYGSVGRAELYLVVLGICALMLLWSKPWLDRFTYGPLEWLWRSLARGRLQPLRRAPPALAAETRELP